MRKCMAAYLLAVSVQNRSRESTNVYLTSPGTLEKTSKFQSLYILSLFLYHLSNLVAYLQGLLFHLSRFLPGPITLTGIFYLLITKTSSNNCLVNVTRATSLTQSYLKAMVQKKKNEGR